MQLAGMSLPAAQVEAMIEKARENPSMPEGKTIADQIRNLKPSR
jgi:hypothetical protein